jgi:hypothetical protein
MQNPGELIPRGFAVLSLYSQAFAASDRSISILCFQPFRAGITCKPENCSRILK